jgi:hypothetical protein
MPFKRKANPGNLHEQGKYFFAGMQSEHAFMQKETEILVNPLGLGSLQVSRIEKLQEAS